MRKKIPVFLLVLCLIGFFWFAVNIVSSLVVFIPIVSQILSEYVPISYFIFEMVFSAIFIVLLVFILQLKKWALISFTVLGILQQLLNIVIFETNSWGLVMILIYAGLLWFAFRDVPKKKN